MRGQAYPLFESGHILRSEMLAATADYAFKFSELLYDGYADGIISGCRLTTTADTIILNKGILIHHGIIYLIKEPIGAAYFPTDTTCVLKLNFLGESREENFVYHDIELRIDENDIRTDNQMELCRFKLQQGARLRYEYVDFDDRSTEYDTLNTIHALYAAKGLGTLSPDITAAFAREMIASSVCTDPIDAAFCFRALDENLALTAEAIAAYLSIRTDISFEHSTLSNEHLYRGLLRILHNLKQGSVNKSGKTQVHRRKIIVD